MDNRSTRLLQLVRMLLCGQKYLLWWLKSCLPLSCDLEMPILFGDPQNRNSEL